MELQINGRVHQVEENLNVAALLVNLKLSPQLVVVELNFTILTQAEFARTELVQGDSLEIVQFVGGG